jgi:DNA invertase Pin-like site-specific DNA recombinase
MNKFEIIDNNDEGIFYVYELFNPIKNEPFYVGKGKNNRYAHHFTTKKDNNKHKKNTIDKIVKLGEKVIVKIVFRSNNEIDVLSKETELILSYGRNDNKTGILTNLTNGGEGISGYIPTKELKELWSKIRKGSNNGMYNKKHTQESLNKMSEIRLEKYKKGEILPTIHTEEWKQHLRTNNPSAKKVDDKLIIELNNKGLSVTEIQKFTGITKRIINNRLKLYNLSNNSKKEKKVDLDLVNNKLLNGEEKSKICEEFNISLSTLNRKIRIYYNNKLSL